MRPLHFLILVCAACFVSFRSAPAAEPRLEIAGPRPNIIVVMTDDQGYADIGLHQNPHLRTPNLDRFAQDGVQFSRFYVSPVCAPTRASVLTGRYHYRTGVIHTSRGGAKMHGDEVTIAERLQAAGYRTGIFGKWHLGDNYPMRPTDQGFGETLAHKSGAIGEQSDAPSSYFDPRLWHNNEPKQTQGYCTDVFFDAALEFIEQNREHPFFVYLPTNAPHTPLDVPASYSDRYKALGLDDTTARVYGMVENIDENFARLIATLDRLDLRQNTLVVFLTDNGAQQVRYNAGLRGRKGTTYEGGIRVPAFFQWPAKVPGRRTIDRIAAHIDLLPTFLNAAGVAPDTGPAIDGISLLPLLTGDAAVSGWPERVLFLQCHRGLEPKRYQHIGVVAQQLKLVGYPGTFNQEDLDPAIKPPLLELYDLTDDRGEEKNLASSNKAAVGELRRAYDAWFDDVRQTRNFAPGVIHVGSEREPKTHLSRYQDGTYVEGAARGWKVKILQGGRYRINYLRGEYEGSVTLVVEWNGQSSRHPLPAGTSRATAELSSGEGTLDIFLESEDGQRLPFPRNDNSGDAILQRI